MKPDYDLAWNNHGVALEALKRNNAALKSYTLALQANPHYTKAMTNRRRLLLLVTKNGSPIQYSTLSSQ
ncbi:MAG: tetratricopeptide repeat protein [Cyanobacteria bacterium J06635_13]